MTNQTKMTLKDQQEYLLPSIYEKTAPLNSLEMRLIAGGEDQGNIAFIKSVHEQQVKP